MIELNAEFLEYTESACIEKPIQISNNIWLEYRYEYQKLYNELSPYLKKGIQLVQKQIQAHSKYEEILIIIQSMWFNYCDFQEEGLTAAIMEWAAQAFGFECPEIPVEYDKENRRYVYDFDAIRFASEQHD